MRGWRRSRLGALAVVVGVALVGCASTRERRGPERPGLSVAEATELIRRWEAEWHAFPGFRAAVDLTVRRRGRSDRAAGMLLLSPSQLRLEVVAPFGLPALVATASPERVVIFRPLERTAWIGPPTPNAMARWLGAPVPLDVLIGLLVGRIPPPADGAPVRVDPSAEAHLVFDRGPIRQRVWVTPEGRPARLLLENGERLLVEFQWTVAGPLASVRVEVPKQGSEVSLRYLSVEYTPAPAEAFELLLPADVKVQPAD